MRKPITCLSVLTFGLLALSAQAQTAPAPATPEQIQKLIELKSYRPALQAIAQILSSAPAGNKYALYMMRGECLLQLKDASTAVLAFDQAATSANNVAQNELARATALVTRKSPGLIYTPRTGDSRTPLDLTDAEARKRAMAALMLDLFPAVEAQAKQAVNSSTLPPILSMGPALRDLHALEVTSAGSDVRVTALVQPLSDHIYTLIEAELNNVNQNVQTIQRNASRAVDWGTGSYGIVNGVVQQIPTKGFSGLTGENRQALRDTIAYLDTIGKTCEDLSAVARSFDRDGKRWQDLAAQTRSIQDFAISVYDHE